MRKYGKNCKRLYCYQENVLRNKFKFIIWFTHNSLLDAQKESNYHPRSGTKKINKNLSRKAWNNSASTQCRLAHENPCVIRG